jgi:diphthamide synthase (EF-2-diphthine--ammonia ligase)
MDRIPVDARVLLSWSSGKDSAWALHELTRQNVHVVGLLTTLNAEAERVAMHAVRQSLLRQQAQAVGLPLVEVDLPWPCSNYVYADRMRVCGMGRCLIGRCQSELGKEWSATVLCS